VSDTSSEEAYSRIFSAQVPHTKRSQKTAAKTSDTIQQKEIWYYL
jgi:hypothetical protein